MDPELLAAVYAAAGRWVGYLSILVIGGAAGFRVAVHSAWRTHAGDKVDRLDHDLHRWSLAAVVVLGVVTLWRLYAQTFSAFGIDDSVTWEYLRIVALDTRWGAGWRWQVAAVVLAGVLVLVAAWRPGARTFLTAAAAVAVVITAPLTGHAVSQGIAPWVNVIVQIAHVAGASLWLGTLLTILLFLRAGRGTAFSAAVRAFSPLALGAVGTLTASGVITAFVYLESISDLWSGAYGRTLTLKLLLFAAVAGLGAYNWRRLKPRLDEPGAARTLTGRGSAELVMAAAVLAVTAVLVALPMPHD
jgi:copper transport protein